MYTITKRAILTEILIIAGISLLGCPLAFSSFLSLCDTFAALRLCVRIFLRLIPCT